jgi:tRNA pseudouridine13 synthase
VNVNWPKAGGPLAASGRIRCRNEDFIVSEQLGFEPGGGGEHAFLHLEKNGLTTDDLIKQVSGLAGIHPRDIGVSGLKDRNAVTRQWLSVRLAGKDEPDWSQLQAGGRITVLTVARHPKKLKRGVHRANRFELLIRHLQGDREQLETRLQQVREQGVPNYFGEQRFGRGGGTLEQALRWMDSGGRKVSRNKRSLYLSVLRSLLFNDLLADRVAAGDWNRVSAGDVCILQGSRSLFAAADSELDDLLRRSIDGDVHPALPLWGKGEVLTGAGQLRRQREILDQHQAICHFLEQQGLQLAHRAARVLADDFCWQFCDDNSVRLEFSLPAGSYATAVLAELMQHEQGDME